MPERDLLSGWQEGPKTADAHVHISAGRPERRVDRPSDSGRFGVMPDLPLIYPWLFDNLEGGGFPPAGLGGYTGAMRQEVGINSCE